MALKLGHKLEELPGELPQVPPEADSHEVLELARQVVERAMPLNPKGAHVSGEPVLSEALVSELQRRGVRCFAATIERQVQETTGPDGSTIKTAVFAFRRWREYLRSSS